MGTSTYRRESFALLCERSSSPRRGIGIHPKMIPCLSENSDAPKALGGRARRPERYRQQKGACWRLMRFNLVKMGLAIVLMGMTLACTALISVARAASPQSQPLLISIAPPPVDDAQTQQMFAQNAASGTSSESTQPTAGISGYFTNWFSR